MKQPSIRSFTKVELMIVLAIVGVLWGFDSNGYHRGFNGAYLDGHAAWISSNAFLADTTVVDECHGNYPKNDPP